LKKTSTTKSVILINMKDAPKELVSWLVSEMNKKNWGIRETAKRAGVSHPTISDIIAGNQPSLITCKKLAKLFNCPELVIIRKAGLIQSEMDPNDDFDQWKHILDQLPQHDRDELLRIAQIKVEYQIKSQERVKSQNVEGAP